MSQFGASKGATYQAALSAAALRQVTDQQDFDRIAAIRDAVTRNMALGFYDDTSDQRFEQLLGALEGAEEALDDWADSAEGDGLGGWRERYRAKKAARKRRRKQRRKDRKERWRIRRKMRRAGVPLKKRRKAFWKLMRKQRKQRRKAYKREKDRIKAGVSRTVEEVSPEEAAATYEPAELEPVAGPGILSALWPADQPIYTRPLAVLGGLALVGVAAVIVIGQIKKDEEEK